MCGVLNLTSNNVEVIYKFIICCYSKNNIKKFILNISSGTLQSLNNNSIVDLTMRKEPILKVISNK